MLKGLLSIFHIHSWEVFSVSIRPSMLDKYRENYLTDVSLVRDDLVRKQVVVLKCTKCGELREKIFDEHAFVPYKRGNMICGMVQANNIPFNPDSVLRSMNEGLKPVETGTIK